MGGVHPTLESRVVASKPEIDFTIVGEGEYAFPKLISAIEAEGLAAVKASAPEAHPGCWSQHNGEIIDRGMAPAVKNLDDLPLAGQAPLPRRQPGPPADLCHARESRLRLHLLLLQ
jgi:radical SAM superfamily enzyme YgiQ (UPF0313 family)